MITKGVVLAGGTGSRLMPTTKVTNKHLLPIYNQPMIFYPLNTLKKLQIKDVLIVCGPDYVGDFANLLGDGAEFDLNFTFRIQKKAAGIADALLLAENFANNENIAVILGDNIFAEDFTQEATNFKSGARIFLKEVTDANRFGVAEVSQVNDDLEVIAIVEKPSKPISNLAVTGLYLFDGTIFDKIKKCQPSNRGELEITDVNNFYIQEKRMSAKIIQGEWTDAGTFESFFRATSLTRNLYLKKS